MLLHLNFWSDSKLLLGLLPICLLILLHCLDDGFHDSWRYELANLKNGLEISSEVLQGIVFIDHQAFLVLKRTVNHCVQERPQLLLDLLADSVVVSLYRLNRLVLLHYFYVLCFYSRFKKSAELPKIESLT